MCHEFRVREERGHVATWVTHFIPDKCFRIKKINKQQSPNKVKSFLSVLLKSMKTPPTVEKLRFTDKGARCGSEFHR